MTPETAPPERVPGLAWELVEGTTIVFDPGRAMAHRLNETAGALWDLLDGSRSRHDVVEALCERYGAPGETVSPAVDTLLEELTRLGLIIDPASPPTSDGSDIATMSDAVAHDDPEPAPVPSRADDDRDPAVGADEPDDDTVQRGPFDALGFSFDITGPGPLVTELGKSLALLATEGPAEHHYEARPTGDSDIELRLDGQLVTTGSLQHVATQALWHVNHTTCLRDRSSLVVHASAVLAGDAIVLFAGDMNAGKSTLVTALASRGWPYVTDEAVALDLDDLSAATYPKPIGLDPGSWPIFPELERVANPLVEGRWWITPSDLPAPGGLAARNRHRHRIAGAVVISYEADAPATITELDPADAVFALIPNLFNLARHPQAGLKTLSRLATGIPVHRLVSGSLDGSVAAVEQVLRNVS